MGCSTWTMADVAVGGGLFNFTRQHSDASDPVSLQRSIIKSRTFTSLLSSIWSLKFRHLEPHGKFCVLYVPVGGRATAGRDDIQLLERSELRLGELYTRAAQMFPEVITATVDPTAFCTGE